MLYVGTAGGVEQELAQRAGVPFRAVESGQLRGMVPWVAAGSLLRMARGVQQAGRLMKQFAPRAVLVTGGFVAAPVVLAAWRSRVPVLIYLPDLEPGLAIRWLSRFARRVAVSFPEVLAHFPGKGIVTGYPVRSSFLSASRSEGRAWLGIGDQDLVLMVFGGSRGARSINRALAAVLPQLLDRCHVIHVSGTLDWDQVESGWRALKPGLQQHYHPFPYLHQEMVLAMAAADLVVARAGASTLGEFPALGLPSILVPYPYSGQHQAVNAAYLVRHGAAIEVADDQLTSRLLPLVLDLLDDRDALASMKQAALALAQPDAAWRIGAELVRLAME